MLYNQMHPVMAVLSSYDVGDERQTHKVHILSLSFDLCMCCKLCITTTTNTNTTITSNVEFS